MIEDGAGKLDKFVLLNLFNAKKNYVTIISRAFNNIKAPLPPGDEINSNIYLLILI